MENNNVIAALFDFDGVVCDTETQYSRFWAEQGDNYNIGIENFSSVIKGSTLRQIFDKYFPGNDALQQRFTHDLDLVEETMSIEFIARIYVFLRELREKGIKTAVVIM